jgi:hypothetical protein
MKAERDEYGYRVSKNKDYLVVEHPSLFSFSRDLHSISLPIRETVEIRFPKLSIYLTLIFYYAKPLAF